MGLERVRRLVDALSDLDSETARRLADIMDAWEAPIPVYERRLVFRTWALLDSDAALDYVSAMGRRTLHRTALASEVMSVVASRDPARARSWLMSLPEAELESYRTALAKVLVESWPIATEGYAGLTELIQTMPLGFDREGAARHLVKELVADDRVDEAMLWAESIPRHAPGQFRGLAFRKVAREVGRDSPGRVSDWLDEHREHRYGQSGIRVLARTWAARDPEAALQWALAQPDDRGRFLSLRFAFQQLYEDDRDAAIAWLGAQPDGAILDPVRLTFALAHVAKVPSQAADAAIAIHDAKSRADTLRKVLGQWVTRDPEAARAWMEAAEKPDSFWQELLVPPSPADPPANPPAPDEARGADGDMETESS